MAMTTDVPRTEFRWTMLFEEGDASMRDLLGGKGAGLAEMSRVGLPVPPGFTITTKACVAYMQSGRQLPEGLMDEVDVRMRALEAKTGKRFGDAANPLLVSVRSGAKFSMPGMMDTVLNLGLNARTLDGLIRLTGNERFGRDAYRRFVQMFGKIVLDIPGERFEHEIERAKARRRVRLDTDLDARDLEALAATFKRIIKAERGVEFPEDPREQLRMAIQAVFDSWSGKRAVDYRTFHGIPHDLGTAVNVQTMVFGNMGADSATGVAFTRNPATGERVVYGEYLVNAQGEDVVAGIRTPKPIAELAREMPESYQEFLRVCEMLERHYRDVQDLEFTIERGRLWMLQTRTGKRTAQAAVKIAVDMAHEGLITREEALLRVEPGQIDQLLHPRFDQAAKDAAAKRGQFLAKGLNASPGAAVGVAVFDADARPEPDFLLRSVPLLLEPGVAAVQGRRRLYHRSGSVVARGQEHEFDVYQTVMQRARERFGAHVLLGGNGMVVNRFALEAVGGWNPGALTEDIDLAIRFHAAGWRVRYCEEAVVWEESVPSWSGLVRQRARWCEGVLRALVQHTPRLVRGHMSGLQKLDLLLFLTGSVVIPGAVFASYAYGMAAFLRGV
ncbi:MAG: pyruvate, phosphate dikinase, partial [Firmicutes bacterium]|nr:pyruvate, phosphate dikinase [Bacillota bacterium]